MEVAHGARCGGIKLRMDTSKLSNMMTASFGDGTKFDQRM